MYIAHENSMWLIYHYLSCTCHWERVTVTRPIHMCICYSNRRRGMARAASGYCTCHYIVIPLSILLLPYLLLLYFCHIPGRSDALRDIKISNIHASIHILHWCTVHVGLALINVNLLPLLNVKDSIHYYCVSSKRLLTLLLLHNISWHTPVNTQKHQEQVLQGGRSLEC